MKTNFQLEIYLYQTILKTKVSFEQEKNKRETKQKTREKN